MLLPAPVLTRAQAFANSPESAGRSGKLCHSSSSAATVSRHNTTRTHLPCICRSMCSAAQEDCVQPPQHGGATGPDDSGAHAAPCMQQGRQFHSQTSAHTAVSNADEPGGCRCCARQSQCARNAAEQFQPAATGRRTPSAQTGAAACCVMQKGGALYTHSTWGRV